MQKKKTLFSAHLSDGLRFLFTIFTNTWFMLCDNLIIGFQYQKSSVNLLSILNQETLDSKNYCYTLFLKSLALSLMLGVQDTFITEYVQMDNIFCKREATCGQFNKTRLHIMTDTMGQSMTYIHNRWCILAVGFKISF